ncbi:hypothetical protein GCM10025768_18680 [Microbacterium pseudoresistens]|uniref:DoxX family protein n=1 Tax=Microbacterium pseudoresistens TaxID=640634 RepID=A0A7Y9EX33_9MICO|nr:hypothetical protein [Microbacterium pseudoresistens]NYD55562.1 hypothetical protein [Microbacterium pseudoresistens]
MAVFIRISLAVLFLDELVVGAWNAFSPETFFQHFPTVDLTPPFSEHYARDFGGATLGIALLLGIALFSTRSHFVVPAASAFSIFAVPHFFYHLAHLDGATVGVAIALSAANASVALLGVAVIVVAIVRDRRSAPSETGALASRPRQQ